MAREKLAIFGFGGLAKEIGAGLLTDSYTESYDFLGFFVDSQYAKKGDCNEIGSVIGNMDDLNSWTEPINIVVALGYPKGLKSVVSRISNPNINFPNLIHRTVIISHADSFHIGKGNIFMRECGVSVNNKFGNFNFFNTGVRFGHDDVVGDFNSFMPYTAVSGNVHIGDYNLFGVGSIIIEKLNIGNNVTLSPGSVLLTKPKDNGLYIGNPAKIMKY